LGTRAKHLAQPPTLGSQGLDLRKTPCLVPHPVSPVIGPRVPGIGVFTVLFITDTLLLDVPCLSRWMESRDLIPEARGSLGKPKHHGWGPLTHYWEL
jgi:hypothetical protein